MGFLDNEYSADEYPSFDFNNDGHIDGSEEVALLDELEREYEEATSRSFHQQDDLDLDDIDGIDDLKEDDYSGPRVKGSNHSTYTTNQVNQEKTLQKTPNKSNKEADKGEKKKRLKVILCCVIGIIVFAVIWNATSDLRIDNTRASFRDKLSEIDDSILSDMTYVESFETEYSFDEPDMSRNYPGSVDVGDFTVTLTPEFNDLDETKKANIIYPLYKDLTRGIDELRRKTGINNVIGFHSYKTVNYGGKHVHFSFFARYNFKCENIRYQVYIEKIKGTGFIQYKGKISDTYGFIMGKGDTIEEVVHLYTLGEPKEYHYTPQKPDTGQAQGTNKYEGFNYSKKKNTYDNKYLFNDPDDFDDPDEYADEAWGIDFDTYDEAYDYWEDW